MAIVGHRGTGKSTAIRKGLRTFGVSRPTTFNEHVRAYTIRAVLGSNAPENVRVLEVNTPAFVHKTNWSGISWPASLRDGYGLRNVQGAIVCYDAGNLGSIRGVPELLGTFFSPVLVS